MRASARWIAVLACAAALLGPRAAATPSEPDAVLRLINESRATRSLTQLVREPALDAIAQRQSERMREAGQIFHNAALADEATRAGVRWTLIGENVGVSATLEDVERAFMDSEPHARNILDPSYNTVGVGVAWTDTGIVYVTQAFAKIEPVRPSATPAPVPVPSETPRPWVEPPAGVPASTPRPPPRAAPVPPGLVRVEDGSVVPASYYEAAKCVEEGWVGATIPAATSLVAASSDAGC